MYLPEPEQQEWLLDQLAALIAKAGTERFLEAPLIEQRDRFFPDLWEPNEEGVRRMAKRVLIHAGLEELDASVEIQDAQEHRSEMVAGVGSMGSRTHSEGAAAWFMGIRRGVCLFGADSSQLENPGHLVGVMAHEVAHAWREHEKLTTRGDEEELLTDLTTVYLGFGILTVNGAYSFRKSGEQEGIMTRTQWSHQRAGYLGPIAMSFLLAAQARARKLGWLARRHIAGELETNQRAYFKAACSALDEKAVASRLRLGAA